MATTYYFPADDGAAEYDPTATQAGSQTFTGNLMQYPATSYTVITANAGTNPQTYNVTLDYTGPGTGMNITTVQTPYSNTLYTETYWASPEGPVLFLLSNSTIAANKTYTFQNASQSMTFDPTGGSTTDPTVCFASGTRIRTARGDVCVEALQVGDMVVTSAGALRPIRWLGHREVDCRRHPRAHECQPVRIAAHAFGPNRPARDLRVSPGHALCVDILDEVLIPAGALVDGDQIEQEVVDTVTYWHVELDGHDVLLAENMPAESYLDMGNRGFFSESDTVVLSAGPDSTRGRAGFCRPFHDDGPVVEAVRAYLRARAGDAKRTARAA